MYALVDCNSFFASCEQVFRPDLRNKPVVVLSNNDGCIVARSKEAKALNIPDLVAYFKLKDFLTKNKVNVFSSNYELYADISNRVVETLRGFAAGESIEVYSIDECFLSLDDLSFDMQSYGHEMKDTIWRDVRMPVCVGVGQSKTLAKLANHIAKKSNRLDGVCVIDDVQTWYPVFKKLSVDKIWGVGSRYCRRLAYLDIHSVYDLLSADTKYIRKHFGVTLERTIAELNGERCMNMDIQPANKKQIYSTRSFGQRIHTLEGLHQAVSQYASTAAVKLRKQNTLVKTVTAFIETSRFDNNPYRNSASKQLLHPTNDTREIISAVKQCVGQVYKPGYAYAKAGIGLIEILDTNPEQLNFFDSYQSERSKELMTFVDKLNKHSKQVFFASSGIDPFWKMQRQLKSPAYTTRLEDIPIIST